MSTMVRWQELSREYEAQRFPPLRRLDVHGESPSMARQRVLHWIQSYAHEEPGQNLLVIVERDRSFRRSPGPVRAAVERLLTELEGGLIDWWQDFGTGGLALRVSERPRIRVEAAVPPIEGDGRTPETAGAATLEVEDDIPLELIELAGRIAEARRDREGLSIGLMEVVLRGVWIEAQAAAMERRISFEQALDALLADELELGREFRDK